MSGGVTDEDKRSYLRRHQVAGLVETLINNLLENMPEDVTAYWLQGAVDAFCALPLDGQRRHRAQGVIQQLNALGIDTVMPISQRGDRLPAAVAGRIREGALNTSVMYPLLDVDRETHRTLTVTEALRRADSLVDETRGPGDWESLGRVAATKTMYPALHAYTVGVSLPAALNAACRSWPVERPLDFRTRWQPFLSLLHAELSQLPLVVDTVYRAVGTADAKVYVEGSIVGWSGIASAINQPGHLHSMLVHGGTLLVIHSIRGRRIAPHSAHPMTEEILFLPESRFRVQPTPPSLLSLLTSAVGNPTPLSVVVLQEVYIQHWTDLFAVLSADERSINTEALRLLGGADGDAMPRENKTGWTLRHCCGLHGGNTPLVRLMGYGSGKEWSELDAKGRTPLDLAVEGGHWDTAVAILEVGGGGSGDAKLSKEVKEELFVEACKVGCLDVVKVLWGNTPGGFDLALPLERAVESGRTALVNLLVGWRVDVPKKILHSAINMGDPTLVEALVRHTTDVNQTEEGVLPLVAAAEVDSPSCLEVLVGAKANLDACDGKGSTALLQAAYSGNVKALEWLVGAKANVGIARPTGFSPVHAAAQNGHVECLKVLIAHTGDVNSGQYLNGNTALHRAAVNGHTGCVRLLIESNAHVNTGKGGSPLTSAARRGHVACVRLLLASTADVNLTRDDVSPALAAVQYGHSECLKCLVDAGANVNAPLLGGFPLVYEGVRRRHTKCLDLLAPHLNTLTIEEPLPRTPYDGADVLKMFGDVFNRKRVEEKAVWASAKTHQTPEVRRLRGFPLDVAVTLRQRGQYDLHFKVYSTVGVWPSTTTTLPPSTSSGEGRPNRYYEVEILTTVLGSQVGWRDGEFCCLEDTLGDGTGDDEHSWAVDGSPRCARWPGGTTWGAPWVPGDILGVAADVRRGNLLFARNGSWDPPFGVAFTGVTSHPLHPTLTMATGRVRLNLSPNVFRFKPPDGSYLPVQP